MTDLSSLTNAASTKLDGLLAALQSGKVAAGVSLDDAFSKILTDSAQDRFSTQKIDKEGSIQDVSFSAATTSVLADRVEKKQNFSASSSSQGPQTTATEESDGIGQKNDGIKAAQKTDQGDQNKIVETDTQPHSADQTQEASGDAPAPQEEMASSEDMDGTAADAANEPDAANETDESKEDETTTEDETAWTLSGAFASLMGAFVAKPVVQAVASVNDTEASLSSFVDDAAHLASSDLLTALDGLQKRAAHLYGLGDAAKTTDGSTSGDALADAVDTDNEAIEAVGLAQTLGVALQAATSGEPKTEEPSALLSLMQLQQIAEPQTDGVGGFGLVSAKETKSFGLGGGDSLSNASRNEQVGVSVTPDLAPSAVVLSVASNDKGREMSFRATNNNGASPLSSVGAVTSTMNGSSEAAATAASGTQKTANAYSFASQLSATKTQQAATTLTAAQQVSVYLQKQTKAGSGDQMTIQLHPAELGRVEVKLGIGSDQQVQATITADNQSTLDLLSRDSETLRQALSLAGLQTDAGSLQFSLRNDGQQGASERSADGSTPTFNGEGEEILSAEIDDPEIYYIAPGRVNVRV